MEKLKAVFIIEMIGKPIDHLKESIVEVVAKLSSEKGVTVVNKKIHEPNKLKDSKDLFSTFAEVEAEFDSLNTLFSMSFAYMPANIEIIYPEKFTISNSTFSELASFLVQRLHNYEAIAKKLVYERNSALKKLQEVAPHLFKKNPEKNKK